MSSASLICLFLIGFVCKAQAFGEYIPRSVYLIDEDGHESVPISVRNKREIQDALLRFKRGGGSAYSYSGSSSSSGGFGPPAELADIQANVDSIVNHASSIPNQIFSRFQDIGESHPLGSGNGGSAYSYSGSTGSGFGSGYSSGSGHSNDFGGRAGSGEHSGTTGNGGSSGPSIFSRSGVEKGTGIKVSSAAQGPNAAFSSSSSSSDGQGNVKYNVKSGQY